MKNLQVNLLIVFALALCGLCVWQWKIQTIQRDEITTMNGMIYEKNAAIQGYTNAIATLNHQVNQMDAHLTDLKAVVATNEQFILSQKADLAQLQFANHNLTNTVAQYQAAVDTLEARLKDAYAGIDKQNATITNLIAQRNDLVQKYNDEVKDRNGVVAKYNELAAQVKKLQAEAAK